MTTIILILVGLFIIWWLKGMRDSFLLKDDLVNILVNEFELTRTEAINLVDRNKRRIFDLLEENPSPMFIATVIYQTSEYKRNFNH